MQDGAEKGDTGNQSSSTEGSGTEGNGAHHFSDVAEDIKQRAAAAKADMRRQAEARADHWRDGAMDTVAQVANALNAAAASLEGGQTWLARPVARIADRVDGFVEAGRDKSLAEIRADFEDMTRHNPVLVVGGAIALGFALSRVLKSSAAGNARPSRMTSPGADDAAMEARDGL